MLMYALFCGVALGCVYDALRKTRFWIGGASLSKISPRMVTIRDRLLLPPSLSLKIRKNKKTSDKTRTVIAAIVLFIQDVLFCLLFAVVAALLLYQTNDGQLRLSAIVVMLLGIGLYLATLGRCVKRFWMVLTIVLRSFVCWIVALLIYPARLLWRWLEQPRRWLIGRLHYIQNRIKLAMERKKQVKIKRKQIKQQQEIAESTITRKLVGQQPDGRFVFVSGGRRIQK